MTAIKECLDAIDSLGAQVKRTSARIDALGKKRADARASRRDALEQGRKDEDASYELVMRGGDNSRTHKGGGKEIAARYGCTWQRFYDERGHTVHVLKGPSGLGTKLSKEPDVADVRHS